METILEQQTPVASCDALLTKSYRIYQEILDLYELIQKSIARSAPGQIQQHLEKLHRLQIDIQTIDSMASESLKKITDLPEKTMKLLQARQAIIPLVYDRNRKLKKSAENIRSHLRHELGSLSQNRTALQGYKPAVSMKKPRINTSY